ncbi:MAG: YraN family protein [Deltaproteobacteria bacterium]|nr:MAG: YraN family protein [Deltaproteobacteria bacterium]
MARAPWNRRRVGARVERRVARWLRARGLRIEATNVRCGRGEIDIVAKEGTCLVFVEVRHRRGTQSGHPAETIGVQKRRALLSAAAHYLAGCPAPPRVRFDVVAAVGDPEGELVLEHLRDAFDGSEL